MLIKNNNLKVARLFFDKPEQKFHIREIARLTGLSAPGVIRIVSKLKRAGILVSEKEKVVENVGASKTTRFIQLKRCYNLISLFDSGLVDFLNQAYEEPEAIVVFGSYSKGEDFSESDIDIAVVTKKEVEIDLKKFEKALARKINVHEIRLKGCEPEFLNNLANGIMLSGYLKIV